jgi:hypothetical protein
MLIFGGILGGNSMAIKKLLDKITGKSQREEAARLELEAKAEKQRKKEEAAKKRREQAEAKKAEEAAKKSDPKARATAAGEPWVNVLGIEVDSDNPGVGAFELDWNDIFVARLIKSGYQGKTDADVVDNWFQDVCRNVVLETYEQEQADPEKRAVSNRRDLGNGRTEVS